MIGNMVGWSHETDLFSSNKYHDTDACRASRIMFQMAGVKTRQYSPTIQHIRLCLSPEDIPPTV